MVLYRSKRLRSSVSTLVAAVMVLTMMPFTAIAATPAQAVLTDAGTTNLANVTGEASNGLNGLISLEVTGTVATKAVFKGAVLGLNTQLNDIQGFLGDSGLQPALTIDYVDPFGVAHPYVITGLTRSSTVGQIITAINAQAELIIAGVDSAGRVTLTAKQFGDTEISGSGSVWEALFVLNGAHNDYSPVGVDYGADYRVIVKFTPVGGGKTFTVETIYPVDGRIGYLDPSGDLIDARDPSSGAYTVVKLGSGWDLLLSTAGPQLGINTGIAKVTLGAGVRDEAPPAWVTVSPYEIQAGLVTTYTVTVEAPDNGSDINVVDRVRLTLPPEFKFTGDATTKYTATVGAAPATATVDAQGVVNVELSRLGWDAHSDKPLVVTLPKVQAATVAAPDYFFGVEYRNIGTTEFLALDADYIDGVRVQPLNEVAKIDLSATGNRAGGVSVIGAHLYDKYNNKFHSDAAGEWARTVDFTVAGPAVGKKSTLKFASVGMLPTDDYYGYRNEVNLSADEGTTTVTAKVVATTDPAKTVVATVEIGTAGVLAPHKLVVKTDTPEAMAGEQVWFHIGLVDKNGKATSFLDGPDYRDYTLYYGQGGSMWDIYSIAKKYSQTTFNTTSYEEAVWDMWAVDRATGAVFESDVIQQVWGEVVEPGVYTDLKVTADPTVKATQVDYYGTNTGNFGYSQADGMSPVVFTVSTVDGNGIPVAKAGITIDVEDLDDPYWGITRPGVITPQSAITNASGVATFTVTSTVPSGQEWWGFAFNEWLFEDRADTDKNASGFAHHYTAIVDEVTVDRTVAKADGTDVITVTAHMADPFEFEPVANAKAMFSQVDGDITASLSATQAMSDSAGKASITVKSANPGWATIRAMDIVGDTWDVVDVRFTDFVVRPLQSSITAQQSWRGPLADVDWVIEDLAGNPVAFDYLSDYDFSGADVYYGDADVSVDGDVINSAIVGYWDLMAGDSVHATFSGQFRLLSTFGYTDEYFAGDVDFLVVDNAGAQVNWIDPANGAFRSRFTATGSDFRRAWGNTNNSVFDLGVMGPSGPAYDWVGVYHTNARAQWVWAGESIVDSSGYLSPEIYSYDDMWFAARENIVDTLTFPLHLGASLPAGSYDLRIDGVKFAGLLKIGGGDALRVAGADRYMTAVELSAANFASADNVVIAYGEDYPDALTASALAGSIGAPILLTRQNSVPAAVLAEIDRLGASKAYIIGGTAAVSAGVATALQNEGLAVERISGADRYATAAAVAEKVLSVKGPQWNGNVFIASGENYPDALSAAPIAGAQGMPILLTRKGSMPAASASFLAANSVKKSYVVGGSAVIGTWVQDAAPGATRIAGADRYETAVKVAEFAKSFGMGYGYLGIASGTNFPDALGGGVVVGRNNGVLLLTNAKSLNAATADAIMANSPARIEVFGGPTAISADVLEALDSMF